MWEVSCYQIPIGQYLVIKFNELNATSKPLGLNLIFFWKFNFYSSTMIAKTEKWSKWKSYNDVFHRIGEKNVVSQFNHSGIYHFSYENGNCSYENHKNNSFKHSLILHPLHAHLIRWSIFAVLQWQLSLSTPLYTFTVSPLYTFTGSDVFLILHNPKNINIDFIYSMTWRSSF